MNAQKYSFWLVCAVSVILFFAPLSVGGDDGFGLDKVVHGGIFLLMVFLGARTYPEKRWPIVAVLVAYMFLVEYIQGKYLPLRHFDWYDIAADSVGLVVGLLFKSKKSKDGENSR